MSSTTVYLHHLGLVCALGSGPEQVARHLFSGERQSLSRSDRYTPGEPLALGEVTEPLPDLTALPVHQRSRSNQLLLAAYQQLEMVLQTALEGLDPLRVGVVLGASTSGIREGEQAMADYQQSGQWPEGFSYALQEMSAPAESLASWLGACGPAFTLSTACSSSAKALASARRLLRSGQCDLVIAGGVDALCSLTVNGFRALGSVSDAPCVPFSAHRRGINIGEGAALFMVSREEGPVALSGVGETSDAHHISAPAPDGSGARAAMAQALDDAGILADAVDYLNLHGTATPQNDAMESLAVNGLFGPDLPCSSTKGFTGHTLGAAGAIEAGFCWLALTGGAVGADNAHPLPLHRWDGEVDGALAPLNLVTQPTQLARCRFAMSNSFAFGGNNIALLLEKVENPSD